MPRRVLSTVKIERCVGWRPSTSLDVTIDLIAQYFRLDLRVIRRPNRSVEIPEVTQTRTARR
jgi:hypothetical protein